MNRNARNTWYAKVCKTMQKYAKVCKSNIKDEKNFLRLGPKFCVMGCLSEEKFEVDIEECVAKLKWDVMGEELKKKDEDPAMQAIDEVIDEDQRADLEEYELQQEGEATSVFLVKGDKAEWQFSKKRVTSMKGNSRVILPGKVKNFKDEAALETLRMETMEVFKQYFREKCNERGEQKSNLSASELRGMKSLKKRVKEGEIVVVQTDKTGKFVVMSREAYEEAGLVHTKKDEEAGQEKVEEIEREINGNVSLMIKFFRLGKAWNQVGRVRETLITKSQSLCPMYLTYKDHKGWKVESGKPPPTRPIAGGNVGLNLNLSELISEVCEAASMSFPDSKEVISTEDLVARIVNLNERKKEWTKFQR